jgi:hypothetical protein
MIHATDEPQLLDDIGRLIAQTAGYFAVWVGFAEHDEKTTVIPIAHAGCQEGYIKQTQVT